MVRLGSGEITDPAEGIGNGNPTTADFAEVDGAAEWPVTWPSVASILTGAWREMLREPSYAE